MPCKPKTLDWLAVGLVPLGLILSGLSTLLPVRGFWLARVCIAAGFGAYGLTAILRRRLLWGRNAQLLEGRKAAAGGAFFLLCGVLLVVV
jgi:hypothetical protein